MSEPRPVYLLSPAGADSPLGGLDPGQDVIALAEASELKDRTPRAAFAPDRISPG